MDTHEEDDISVVSVQDSDWSEDLKFPNFNIRLLPSMTQNTDSEIKQAHTALTTAYSSIKTKLSKVEQQNKELKMLLNRKKNIPDQSTGYRGGGVDRNSVNGDVATKPTSHSEILRQKRPGLTEESHHKRHGSWAYFNDKTSDQGSYVQFIEAQIENNEKEKMRLQEELEQLRVRYTDNDLQITKLIQEGKKQDTTIQQLRKVLQEKEKECQRQKSENEELRKMNINLQHQLKKTAESYDRVCVTNKTLEDRLQHHVDVQTRNQRTDNPESLRLSVTDTVIPNNTDTVTDTDLMSSLHQSLSHIQEQNMQLSSLRQLALQQQAAIRSLQQKFTGEAQAKEPSGHPVVATVTMQHPITCEDDLENVRNNRSPGSGSVQKLPPKILGTKMDESNDETTEKKLNQQQLNSSRHLQKLRFPSQNSEDFEHFYGQREPTPPLEDLPWAPVKTSNSNNPFLPMGEIRSDGVFDEMPEEMPVEYSESEDFTIHDSEESQTQVKHRLPSTTLENNNSRRTSAPQIPYPADKWTGLPPGHYQVQNNCQQPTNTIAYPPATLASPLEVPKPHKLTEIKMRYPQQRPNISGESPINIQGTGVKSRLQPNLSQSETIGRVTGPPAPSSGVRQRHGSTEIIQPSTDSVENCHSSRCTAQGGPLIVGGGYGVQNIGHGRHSPQQQHKGNSNIGNNSPLWHPSSNLNPQPINNLSNIVTSTTTGGGGGMNHPVIQGNRSPPSSTSPRPLNNIEQNVIPGHALQVQRNNSNKHVNRDVNIKPEQPVEKLPSGSPNITQPPLNNDPLLNSDLAAPKPVAHRNLNSTYLTVRLPPVENAEASPLGDRPEAQTCPVCTQLFPVATRELQEEFERHVNDCLPDNDLRRGVSAEARERQCIMCERKFPVVEQTAYEAHVQSHFVDEVADVNFEVLQV